MMDSVSFLPCKSIDPILHCVPNSCFQLDSIIFCDYPKLFPCKCKCMKEFSSKCKVVGDFLNLPFTIIIGSEIAEIRYILFTQSFLVSICICDQMPWGLTMRGRCCEDTCVFNLGKGKTMRFIRLQAHVFTRNVQMKPYIIEVVSQIYIIVHINSSFICT